MPLVKVAPIQGVTVPQSTILIGAVLLGFLVYLAMNGKLLTYWALMTGQNAPAGSTAAKTAASPPATQPPQTVLTQSNALGTFAGATSDVLSAIEAFGVAP